MKSSKIYNEIKTDRKGNKSFGCNEFLNQEIYVGTSKANSYLACSLSVSQFESSNSRVLHFVINFNDLNGNIKRIEIDYSKRTKEFTKL